MSGWEQPTVLSEESKGAEAQWQQGQLLEVTIADLSQGGDGVGRWQGRVVFVPDTVPGDRVLTRLVRVKPQYAHGKLQQIVQESPHRIRPACIVADKCGGCQWQHIDYDYQRTAKRNLVVQALAHIGGLEHIPVAPMLNGLSHQGYRNKATYPLGRSATGQVQAGYYRKSSHQLINLNQCPIQDPQLNPLLAEVKHDIQEQGWSIYNESEHRGKLRHLGLRIGRRTGEMLITLVSTDSGLTGLAEQAQAWMERYPKLVGVALNINSTRTNAVFGAETRLVVGRLALREEFAGLQFQVLPTTFFQVYTEQAEALVQVILDELNLQGDENIVDTYCGIGTLTLPLARYGGQVIGIESQVEAVKQARDNAALNDLSNVTIQVGAVEAVLPTLSFPPDVVVLDPPRKGCHASVIQALIDLQPHRIVYVSCNPATLARDLKRLCEEGGYRLTKVQPADFFPQTAHVECAAFLVR